MHNSIVLQLLRSNVCRLDLSEAERNFQENNVVNECWSTCISCVCLFSCLCVSILSSIFFWLSVLCRFDLLNLMLILTNFNRTLTVFLWILGEIWNNLIMPLRTDNVWRDEMDQNSPISSLTENPIENLGKR